MTEATTPQISTTTLPARTPRVVIPAPQPSSPAQLRQTIDATTGEPTPASDKPTPGSAHEASLATQIDPDATPPSVETPPKKRGRKPKAEGTPASGQQPPTPFGFRRRVVVDAPEYRFGTPGSSYEYVVELDPALEIVELHHLPDTGSVEDAESIRMPVAELRKLVAWSTALLAMLDGNG